MKYLRYLLVISSLLLSLNSMAISESEKQLRAMFIYNFANLVEWPAKAFAKRSDPLKLCVVGDVPFIDYLYPMAGTFIGPREFQITQSNSLQKTGKCQILFVGDDIRPELLKAFKSGQYIYILSVSEQSGFIENGGIINIVNTVEKLSFDINLDSARKQGLQVSSDLISLARNIRKLQE